MAKKIKQKPISAEIFEAYRQTMCFLPAVHTIKIYRMQRDLYA